MEHVEWLSAELGWWLFPCRGKQPATVHGYKDATRDPALLAAWFDREHAPNLGVDCGRSGIVVVDVDRVESLGVLFAAGGLLPRTLTSLTGGGGVHYVYRAPDEALRNTAGRLPGIEGSLPGIDLRASGGYIVAPPSLHPSGVPYEFMSTRWATEPAECPAWLRPSPVKSRTRLMDAVLGINKRRGPAYVEAAVRTETETVANAPEGARNDALVRAAFSLGTLGREVLSEQEAEAALLPATTLPEMEARATIRSGYTAGTKHPRRR